MDAEPVAADAAPTPTASPALLASLTPGLLHRYATDLADLCVAWRPAQVPQPGLAVFNHELARELGWATDALDTAAGGALFAGNVLPDGAKPVAQGYAGHQFGGYSPQLGDGRALLLGEVRDAAGQLRDVAFKGSGRTPFSRGGDGKAALGPMLREYLVSEAMHALGVPTTRSLAVATTGERIRRDTGALPGAVLTRVAASHIRVGTFQWVAAQGDEATLRRLADFTLARHYPELARANGLAPEESVAASEVGASGPSIRQATSPTSAAAYLALLAAVCERQAALVAQWMGVGFVHGVMNTDNMTLSGETIDYGPCAFMEAFDPDTVFSSIDHGGRYAWGNQPGIAQWNLARLAETLLPLLHTDSDEAVALATDVINRFPALYRRGWLAVMRAKLGLQPGTDTQASEEEDLALIQDWLAALQGQGADWTLAHRHLCDVAEAAEADASDTPGPAHQRL
ncbi:MAG: protein adenylyltransferase SelO, partial [Burkholderiaceae bacterium]